MTSKVIALAVGGSGGHLLPAQVLARELKAQDPRLEIYFLGGHLDQNPFFSKSEFPFVSIPAASFSKKNRIPLALVSILKGCWRSILFFYKKRPALVIGFGSYHSLPVLLAAKLFAIEMLLFEANCIPGKVNRFFAKGPKSQLIAQFPFTFSKPVIPVTRFPWKEPSRMDRKEAKKLLGFDPGLPLFLVFGGSQGALFINDLLPSVIPLLQKEGIFFSLIHLTGSELWTFKLEKIYRNLRLTCLVQTFASPMEPLYAAADLVIARAGAGTLSELIHYERASILIPYPHASEDHQGKNSAFMAAEIGGGVEIAQQAATPESVAKLTRALILENRIPLMEKALHDYKVDKEKSRQTLPYFVLQKLETHKAL